MSIQKFKMSNLSIFKFPILKFSNFRLPYLEIEKSVGLLNQFTLNTRGVEEGGG